MQHKTGSHKVRFLNRDRSFNIDSRRGIKAADLYHSLLSAKWRTFLGFALLLYLGINFIFGLAYFCLPHDALSGIESVYGWRRLGDCFFFSVQTIATIGYGRVSPYTLGANILMTVESLFGLTGLAVGTGIFFARFSRPTARVRFSRVALVTRRNGRPCLTVRLANERLNQIVEARVTMSMLRREVTQEGQSFRKIHDMKLERSQSSLFTLSWALFHPIDSDSPLFGQTRDSLKEAEAEVFVALTGIDDTFSQTIHDRYSYAPDDLVWNATFEDVLTRMPDGRLRLELDKLHDYVSIPAGAGV